MNENRSITPTLTVRTLKRNRGEKRVIDREKERKIVATEKRRQRARKKDSD